MSESKKYVHVSFRIPVELKSELEKEAKRHIINLNALTIQVLSKYVTFDRIEENLEAISLSKSLFVGMLDKVETSEMEFLGRELGSKLAKQAFAFLNLDFGIEGLIEGYFRPLSLYSNWYNLNVVGVGANRKLLFKHQLGPKWSVFLKAYLAATLESATGKKPTITVTDGLVSVFT